MALLIGLGPNSAVVNRIHALKHGDRTIDDDAEAERYMRSMFGGG